MRFGSKLSASQVLRAQSPESFAGASGLAALGRWLRAALSWGAGSRGGHLPAASVTSETSSCHGAGGGAPAEPRGRGSARPQGRGTESRGNKALPPQLQGQAGSHRGSPVGPSCQNQTRAPTGKRTQRCPRVGGLFPSRLGAGLGPASRWGPATGTAEGRRLRAGAGERARCSPSFPGPPPSS